METLPVHFLQRAATFLQALVEWQQQLPTLAWEELRTEAREGRVVLFSVDMINGFCTEGALASPRVQAIIPAVVAAFEGAYAVGVRDFVLAQDCHQPDALEFAAFPPHCQVGTSEAQTIPELASLPFADLFTIIPKNSLNAFHETQLGDWLEARHNLAAAVVVGDCTDLCVHQMALHLKLFANARHLNLRVIVPENAVQTYDMPVDTARAPGALPHDADVMHLLFLYHMQLNGVQVARSIN